MKKRWIAIGIWSIGAVLIGTGQLNGCLGLNEDRGMISYAAGQSQASKTIQNKIEKSNKTTRSLEEEKKTLKKEVASLEAKKVKADAKAAEEAKKAEAEDVLKKLLASGVSADEILAKLK